MTIRALLSTAVAALVALSVAACGGGGGEARPAGDNGLTQVNFAVLPIGQVAPFVLAEQQGIFERHGIDLNMTFVEPPALVPSAMSGDADFIWNNPPGLLAARSNNVPIKAVTTVSVAGSDPSTFPIQVMVAPGSPIRTVADLAGTTVATGALFQLNDLALMESLARAGVDVTTVEFVEVPFPNMGEALAAGRADAVISTEPFVSILKASGQAVPLVSVSEGLAPTTPISDIAASEQFIAQNPELVADFRAAVDEAFDYARAHDADVRATIPQITELTPELAAVVSLAPLGTTDDPAGWETWANLLVQVGVVDEKPNASEAFLAD